MQFICYDLTNILCIEFESFARESFDSHLFYAINTRDYIKQ